MVWPELLKDVQPISVTGCLWRVVESQRQIATINIVDNLAEQAVLEDLLENSKPSHPPGCDGLHYLLKTPFRYPPLRWGSRFGSRFELSIFYGAKTQTTALAETAFYRLLFLQGMSKPPVKLTSQHLMFSAYYHSKKAIQLQHSPFKEYSTELADPGSYVASQSLGTALREQGYQLIEFISARDEHQGINVAITTPHALHSRQPEKTIRLLMQTNRNGVEIKLEQALLQFPIDQFLVDGELSYPQ